MSIDSRLKKAEQIALARKLGTDNRPCDCPNGQRQFYFIVTGTPETETREHIPHNRQRCKRCGGKNTHVVIDKTDLGA